MPCQYYYIFSGQWVGKQVIMLERFGSSGNASHHTISYAIKAWNSRHVDVSMALAKWYEGHVITALIRRNVFIIKQKYATPMTRYYFEMTGSRQSDESIDVNERGRLYLSNIYRATATKCRNKVILCWYEAHRMPSHVTLHREIRRKANMKWQCKCRESGAWLSKIMISMPVISITATGDGNRAKRVARADRHGLVRYRAQCHARHRSRWHQVIITHVAFWWGFKQVKTHFNNGEASLTH